MSNIELQILLCYVLQVALIDPIEVGVSDAVVLKSAQCEQCVQCVQRSTVIETAADRGEV